jgi:hypothetical protein
VKLHVQEWLSRGNGGHVTGVEDQCRGRWRLQSDVRLDHLGESETRFRRGARVTLIPDWLRVRASGTARGREADCGEERDPRQPTRYADPTVGWMHATRIGNWRPHLKR